MKRIPFIVGNWKCNPNSAAEAQDWTKKIELGLARFRKAEVAILPPFVFLSDVRVVAKITKVGAQNCFWEAGAYTGEVSWKQLKNMGIDYVLVGHSERKHVIQETDEMINKKVVALLKNQVATILCIGETQREVGNEVPAVVGDQLRKALFYIKAPLIKNLTVAYEPVWAISTTNNAIPDTPTNALHTMLYIKKILTSLYNKSIADKVRIIYGGSVNPGNIRSFLSEGEMEGALVGGASLNPAEFIATVKNAVE